MKICLIAEGSYPYITGGVSSWIQMLVSNMPEHEFIILAISSKESENRTYKYKIPSNVIEIKDIYLEVNEKDKKKSNKKVEIKNREVFKSFLIGENFKWQELFDCINNLKDNSITDILSSRDFFEIVNEIASTHYNHVIFNKLFWAIRSMMITMLQIIKSDIPKADIYHSVSTGYAGLLGAFGKYNNRQSKFILTEHGIYTREREEEIIKSDWVEGYFKDNWIKYFYNLSSSAYGYSDKVITLFEKNRELQIELGCEKEKISIIPNGVKIERFKDINNKNDDECINIGAIVRVVPIKDIKTIIQAFNIANESISNMKLYIIGPLDEDEDYTKECNDLVRSLGNKNIIFTGRVDIANYIGKMDMIVLGSISEGQPLSVLEAMSCKKPLITTNVGACKELLYGNNDNLGKCGIVVPVMGCKEMANAMIKLANDEKLRLSMGEIGFKRVSIYYREEQFIEKYKNMYMGLGEVYGWNRI